MEKKTLNLFSKAFRKVLVLLLIEKIEFMLEIFFRSNLKIKLMPLTMSLHFQMKLIPWGRGVEFKTHLRMIYRPPVGVCIISSLCMRT